jgi:hypothetical protein
MCSVAAPMSLADQSFNTLEGSGSLTYLPFALADASGEPCPSDYFDIVYHLQIDRDLPPWLSIAHDPALHTISWSSQRAPAGINETFLLTLTATIGANHSLAHNSTSFTLTTLSPSPYLNLDP